MYEVAVSFLLHGPHLFLLTAARFRGTHKDDVTQEPTVS